MNKRDFNKLLKRIVTQNKIDIKKIKNLTNEERSDMVHHIVRNRGPIVKELIPEGFDNSWLNCMAYMYYTKSKKTGLNFRHTSEHTIR